ncbi:hypothetical protein Hamer_G013378 [Homarus americanus]|uniref:Uncharacterized protein n=1 Tax=Homarus americanus TaxID=6706 RepID=A0A8J5K8V6_HOMAM|nr:hypothetical protein Hamer_G013378 [Homarus americanus]
MTSVTCGGRTVAHETSCLATLPPPTLTTRHTCHITLTPATPHHTYTPCRTHCGEKCPHCSTPVGPHVWPDLNDLPSLAALDHHQQATTHLTQAGYCRDRPSVPPRMAPT